MSSQCRQSGSSMLQNGMLLRSKFLIQQRLPQQVFADTTEANYLFFEYAYAFGQRAWNLFTRLTQHYGDTRFGFTTLEPDAYAYYLKQFGEPMDAWFGITASPTEYTQQMFQRPSESRADAPAYRTDIAVWASESGRWRCWGERDLAVCVVQIHGADRRQKVRLYNEIAQHEAHYVPLFTVDEVLHDVLGSAYEAAPMTEFSRQFRHNYGS